ncbi:MAG: CBS domain-containing protein [Candidatus Lokiarchaeota archaeon]|nr:CBS domain-containing protein [Candidatus Lokiarchaeota archaeon]MBD3198967.1 CBS domain-containing protein [Candidatus Lokiarchaeota archaeon]
MKIGTVKGIEVNLHLSTLAIVGLVGFYAASFYYSLTGVLDILSLIIVGLINGFIMLFSILAHELMHSIIALRHELNVSEIELYMFGGVSNIEEEPRTPRSETIISAVGPVTSLIMGGLFLAPFFLSISVLGLSIPAILYVTLFYTGLTNISLGVFNFLPAFPMDGGRILRAYLWKRRDNLLSATETASKVGYYFGWAFVGYGFFEIIFLGGGLIGGFWLIIIGFFLSNSSRNAYRQTVYEFKLSKLSAREIFTQPEESIPFDMKIKDAVREYFMKYRRSYFPVSKDGDVVGVINVDDIQKIPMKDRAEKIIGYAMENVKDFPKVNVDETGKEAFNKLKQEQKSPKLVAVEEENKVIGFIGQNEISSAIRISDLLFGEKI